MNKKGVIIASILSATVILVGCIPRQLIHSDASAYQTGPSTKLGHPNHHCKYHRKNTHKNIHR